MRWLRTSSFSFLAIGIALASLAGLARAEVKLPPFFSDHMVLQRETKAPIWGTAAAGEKVTVQFRDQKQEATANAAGNWRVELKGLKAGGPDELTIAGTNTVKFSDVLVGEVWVGSGQSNMQGTVGGYAKGDEVLAQLAAKEFPNVRGCTARNGWKVATPNDNNGFSAILFAFAVRVHEGLDVPVGMMLGAVGGTPSGAWVNEEALTSDPACQKQLAQYAATGYDAEMKDYEQRILPAWEKAAEAAKAASKPAPGKPQAPFKPGLVGNQTPGFLYKANIQPLAGYGIRGVLWDQGESRTAVGGVDQYTLMGALIRGWRKDWNAGDFAFIYVQKPSGGGPAWDKSNPVTSQGEAFAAQPTGAVGKLPTDYKSDGGYVDNHVRIMNYPNVGMAIGTDLGSGVHPTNKSGYGSRAAAVALGMTYGKAVEYYGPIYASHALEAGKVRIKFTHVGKGLAIAHSEKLQGFVIAGDDQNFVWADAVIDGDTVVVSSPQVPKPAAVRYAWSSRHPWANLFNKDGLPAVTFRTDAW